MIIRIPNPVQFGKGSAGTLSITTEKATSLTESSVQFANDKYLQAVSRETALNCKNGYFVKVEWSTQELIDGYHLDVAAATQAAQILTQKAKSGSCNFEGTVKKMRNY